MYVGINGPKITDSGGDAGCAIGRTLEAQCTGVDCTFSPLASDIPCTLDSGAILSFANRRTSTTRFKFIGSVKAFEIAGETARVGNGTCSETHRTELSGGQQACRTLLLPSARGLGMTFLATVLV